MTTSKAKRIIFTFLFTFCCAMSTTAQIDFLQANRNVIPGGYDFWVYTPEEYYYTQEHTPCIIFLHGASLCSRNLNRSRRYGPLDAIVRGRQIPALVIVPQNPGGAWNPEKINDVLEWTKKNYAMDSTRVYVIGMSLGGYGTLDFAGTYPKKVAAAMALCGGCSLTDQTGLGELPLWIIHGTGDRAVSVRKSQTVVEGLKAKGLDKRLRFDWWKGASHGALARVLYMAKTYDWLFSHTTKAPERNVNKVIDIKMSDLKNAYEDMIRDYPDPEVIDD